MKKEIIKAITDFIFVEDIPQRSDIVLMSGGSHLEMGEKSGGAVVTLACSDCICFGRSQR